jgi:hypothetical protein
MINFDQHHNLGISFITVSFIYLLYETLKSKQSLTPKYFLLLYSIGGFFLMFEMISQSKPFVFYQELVGALITLFLFFYSIYLKVY